MSGKQLDAEQLLESITCVVESTLCRQVREHEEDGGPKCYIKSTWRQNLLFRGCINVKLEHIKLKNYFVGGIGLNIVKVRERN